MEDEKVGGVERCETTMDDRQIVHKADVKKNGQKHELGRARNEAVGHSQFASL